jgi:4-amino-4-deoxy-L-arabinose transferase-like glycosyltransferase
MTSIAAESSARLNGGRLSALGFGALLSIALLAWLPGLLSLPALDRDESRFAQASRQMVESGDYVDIRFSNAPRYNKPVGIYWLQSAAVIVARAMDRDAESRIWIYRIPSFLAGLLALFLTYWTARAFAPRSTAFIGASLLGLTLLVAAESEIATTDAALLACVVGAQGALLRVWLGARGRQKPPGGLILAGWAAVGAGILIKGPVIAGAVGATAIALSLWQRQWRWLKQTRPLKGLAIALAMVAPWAIAIGLASHGAFYSQSLGHDLGAKLIGGQESHGAPPGYYLAFLSITFWPATLFLAPALVLAIRNRHSPQIQFLVAWAASSFLLFELVPTKLPHYILPAYPALALLVADWIGKRRAEGETRVERFLRYFAAVQFLLIAVALSAAPSVLMPRFGAVAESPWIAPARAIGLVLALGAVAAIAVRSKTVALVASGACAIVLYGLLTLAVAPQLGDLWLSQRTAALISHLQAVLHRPPRIVAAGYAEPSLVFLLGNDVTFTSPRDAANIAVKTGDLAVIEASDSKAFLAALAERYAVAAPLGEVSGFNYSKGRKQHLTLYRAALVANEIHHR